MGGKSWLGVVALLSACGGEGPGDVRDEAHACVAGEVVECSCPGGGVGSQLCLDPEAGSYAQCQCPIATSLDAGSEGTPDAFLDGGASDADVGNVDGAAGMRDGGRPPFGQCPIGFECTSLPMAPSVRFCAEEGAPTPPACEDTSDCGAIPGSECFTSMMGSYCALLCGSRTMDGGIPGADGGTDGGA